MVVGDATVGKSSLISHDQNYVKDYVMTVGADLTVKEFKIPKSSITVDLFILDMGGQSIFNQREAAKAYWNDCSYVICIFDVSSRKSLQSCAKWVQSVRSSGKGASIPALLVANKIDLREGVRKCAMNVALSDISKLSASCIK